MATHEPVEETKHPIEEQYDMVIEGLKIIRQYSDGCDICAEHDIIYAGPYFGDFK